MVSKSFSSFNDFKDIFNLDHANPEFSPNNVFIHCFILVISKITRKICEGVWFQTFLKIATV